MVLKAWRFWDGHLHFEAFRRIGHRGSACARDGVPEHEIHTIIACFALHLGQVVEDFSIPFDNTSPV
jgi:hypothetical protein